MAKHKKLKENQKQELVEALKVLYPTPLCEKFVDRFDEKYIKATEFIDKNYAKLDERIRAYYPTFIFKMNGDIEFLCSKISDLDIVCNGKDGKVLTFSADGKLEKVTSLKDFQNISEESIQK